MNEDGYFDKGEDIKKESPIIIRLNEIEKKLDHLDVDIDSLFVKFELVLRPNTKETRDVVKNDEKAKSELESKLEKMQVFIEDIAEKVTRIKNSSSL